MPPRRRGFRPGYQPTHASADFHGGDADPHVWTRLLGVAPTDLVEKGRPHRLPSGIVRDGHMNFWSLSTRGIVLDEALRPHLAYLVDRLALPRDDLGEAVRAQGWTFRFFCFWNHGDGYRPFVVDDDLDEIVRRSGGTIEVDEYDFRTMARTDATITSFDGMPDIALPPEAERAIRRALAGDDGEA